MYWQSALALFVGLAAALPTAPGADEDFAVPRDLEESDDGLFRRADIPSAVKILHIGYLGTGCPRGTADVTVDATKTLFEATFSEFTVQTGPGTKASDWRKNCKLTINMQFDRGFQFSILETTTRGFAEIPRGSRGQCDNVFFFTGQRQIVYNHRIPSPFSGLFELPANPGIISYSQCGSHTAILNMNTQCFLSPTDKKALINVDSVSGQLKVKFSIKWRRC